MDEKGLVITQVRTGSVAAIAGIQPGAVIQEMNRTPVNNTDEFLQAVAKTPERDSVLLLIREDEYSRFVALKIE